MNSKSIGMFLTVIFITMSTLNIFPQIYNKDTTIKLSFNENKLNMLFNLESNIQYYKVKYNSKLSYNNKIRLISFSTISGFDFSEFSLSSLNYRAAQEEFINTEFNSYLKLSREFEIDTDLGIASKIIGHSETLMTFILAVIHIIKYKTKLY